MTDQDAIGNATFYTVHVRDRTKIRPFFPESEVPETLEETLAIVQELDGQVAVVFRHDCDIPRKDVTEDIARLWHGKLIADGHGPHDAWPDFLMEHAPTDCDLGYSGPERDDDDRAHKGAWAI